MPGPTARSQDWDHYAAALIEFFVAAIVESRTSRWSPDKKEPVLNCKLKSYNLLV